ncbi:hypothetical protein OG976_22755 [Mycobacterium sp. NBC_00419]|uniref:YveK family protein n=1 Tax=Mycobacterium sp. NBC_00419 TaxID=2975989 RepID=UPI002E1DDF07
MIAPPHAPRLRDYAAILRQSWLVIVSATVLAGAAGFWVAQTRDTTYTAHVPVFAMVPGAPEPRSAFSGSRDALARMQGYSALAVSQQVLARTIAERNLATTPRRLAEQVTAQVTPGSVLLDVGVSDTSGQQAVSTADALARNLVGVARELEWSAQGPTGELIPVGSASAVEVRAAAGRYVTLGAVLGFVLSCVLVLARGIRGATVLTTAQLDHVVVDAMGEAQR